MVVTSDRQLPLVQTFARNLRTYREQAGLSQEGLADKAGLDRTYVSSCERAKRNATLQTVERLAHALGLSPVELLHVEPEK